MKYIDKNYIQLQCVVPLNIENVFNDDFLNSILRIYSKYKLNKLSLILLKSIFTGTQMTEYTLRNINFIKLGSDLIDYINILLNKGIYLAIEGFYSESDKSSYYIKEYFKQIVICPDGNVYPDYDFYTRNKVDFIIGSWKSNEKQDLMIEHIFNCLDERCKKCNKHHFCRLKFIKPVFDSDLLFSDWPRCKEFIDILYTVILYLTNKKRELTNGLSS